MKFEMLKIMEDNINLMTAKGGEGDVFELSSFRLVKRRKGGRKVNVFTLKMTEVKVTIWSLCCLTLWYNNVECMECDYCASYH